ncbi:MAG: hypothetical protein NC305_02380 [Lachnospiraceae bacterium]|nr:hypothetical protein [Lachnospiraceae bacterium]
MIENKTEVSKDLEKALQALEQAKQRVANEKKKQNEKKRKAEKALSHNPAEKFITTRKIDSFESLARFTADREQKYGQLDSVHLSKGQKPSRLKELSKMYALYEPYCTTYKESQSLKGIAKMKFDKEHKESLAKYPEMCERLQSLLGQGEKITPKQWKAEQIPPQTPKQEPVSKPAEKETPSKPKIPPKPVMSAEAAAYPKLFKIYKELKRQNEIIFEAEKERNVWELERDDLKGFARFTKKGELQGSIPI